MTQDLVWPRSWNGIWVGNDFAFITLFPSLDTLFGVSNHSGNALRSDKKFPKKSPPEKATLAGSTTSRSRSLRQFGRFDCRVIGFLSQCCLCFFFRCPPATLFHQIHSIICFSCAKYLQIHFPPKKHCTRDCDKNSPWKSPRQYHPPAILSSRLAAFIVALCFHFGRWKTIIFTASTPTIATSQ